jgi:hypothetical protein
MTRSEIAVALFCVVVAVILCRVVAYESEQYADDIMIQAAAPTSPPVRPECTMGPPSIQKSDARRIA